MLPAGGGEESVVKRTLIGLLLAALSVSGFASTFIFGAALTKGESVSPAVLSFLRFTIAGLVMLGVGCATANGRRKLIRPTRADWRRFLWLGPVGTSLMAIFVFMGCARVSAANASMADALTPLMIFSVSALRARRASLRELGGLLCGFVGALLVIQVIHAGGLALSAYSLGDVFILLSAAVWGVYTVYGRAQIARLGSSVFTTWTMLVGAFVLVPILLLTPQAWPRTPHAWLLVGLLGCVSTLLPFWTWNAAQKFLPVSVLGVSAYFTPIVAVALAGFFLGEKATTLQWLGTIFVLASATLELRGNSH